MWQQDTKAEKTPHYKVLFGGPGPSSLMVAYLPQTQLERLTGMRVRTFCRRTWGLFYTRTLLASWADGWMFVAGHSHPGELLHTFWRDALRHAGLAQGAVPRGRDRGRLTGTAFTIALLSLVSVCRDVSSKTGIELKHQWVRKSERHTESPLTRTHFCLFGIWRQILVLEVTNVRKSKFFFFFFT